ncbi:MAG: SpoIVB peptidase S55 domain-containing protein, partial [Polyangiaceae bacterium]
DTALPSTLARVLWIYASDQHSFKVGEATKPLGALVQDRQSAVVVDEKAIAPEFPVHIDVVGVDGAPQKSWNMVVANERFMSPGLVASMLGSVIEATVQERRDVTWQLHSKVSIQNHGTLEFDDFGVADGGMPDSGEWGQSQAVRAIGDVLNNPWENTRIEKYEATLYVHYTRDLWRIRGVETGEPEVEAGDRARIIVHLEPFAGPAVTRTLEVTMPKELAGKEVELEILPGYDVAPEQATPENLAELLANEPRQSLPPRSLVVQFKLPSQGVAFGGHVANELPDFALSALRPSSATVAPEPFTSYSRTTIPMDRYIEGRDKVKIKVRATPK